MPVHQSDARLRSVQETHGTRHLDGGPRAAYGQQCKPCGEQQRADTRRNQPGDQRAQLCRLTFPPAPRLLLPSSIMLTGLL